MCIAKNLIALRFLKEFGKICKARLTFANHNWLTGGHYETLYQNDYHYTCCICSNIISIC